MADSSPPKKQSVHSGRSSGSGKSKSSFGSKISSFGKKSAASTPSQALDVTVGDFCETLSPVTMREEESVNSEIVTELHLGTTCEVIEVGIGRRIKVRHKLGDAPAVEGWISSRTSLNEPLVVRRKLDTQFGMDTFEVGGQHEVKSVLMLRAEEQLDSEPICELRPGSLVRILELGKINQRRVKVTADTTEGWISAVTKDGELLIGKVGEHHASGGFFGGGTSATKTKALLNAARMGDLAMVKKVAESGDGLFSRSKTNLNCSDIRGKTALIYASACGHIDVVQYLLSRAGQVDVNMLDDTQKGALHYAAKRPMHGDIASLVQGEIVEALIQAGAYIEARDHNGCTALIFAVANGDATVVQRFIDKGADINVRDFEGHTPLDYARNFDHTDVERVLQAAGAEATHADSDQEDDEEGSGSESSSECSGESRTGSEAEPAAQTEPPQVAPASPRAQTDTPTLAPAAADAEPAIAAATAPAVASGTAPRPAAKKKAGAKKKAAAGKAQAKKKAGAKAKAGAKKKAAAGKPKFKAKLDLLGDDSVEQAEVTVQEPAKEEEDEKTRVLRKLQVVMDTVSSPSELDAVIQHAEAAGATEGELETARQKLAELKSRMGAREALAEATRNKDVKSLRALIPEAEQQGVPKADLEKARKVLKAEEPRQAARDQLLAAHEVGDPKALKAAVAAAKKAGLPAEEIGEYEELLAGAENKDKATKALADAVKALDVAALRLAIDLARGAGVDAGSIAEAEGVLKVEEPKAKARDEVYAAIESGDVDRMKKAVVTAKAANLDASEIQEVEAAIQRKADAEKFMKAVTQAMKDSEGISMKDPDVVRAAKEHLAEAIAGAISMGVPEADLANAELRRKKLHNTIEDLKGSIRVFCRIRPLNSREKGLKDHEITKQVDPMTLAVGEHGQHVFHFDAVFTPGTQDEIFEDCKDLVQSAVDGYNVTLFAYGQTGAGKTFTMAGVPGMLGVSPRTITEIYDVIEKGKARFNYTVMGSMLELYRQDLVDLLAKGNPAAEKAKLQVRVEKSGMVSVEHLIAEQCRNAQELESLLERGTKSRAVAATAMNSESSRSHLVLMVQIISVNRETKNQLRGKILIVDLAGSERLKKSQTTADMQKESIEINKSLTALGDVIEALTKHSKVIPYRNHKLTQLMQDALGGSAKTLMFVNCSPASSNEDETIMSLKYAARAKKITNKR